LITKSQRFKCASVCTALCLHAAACAFAHKDGLEVELLPHYSGKPLAFDAVSYTNAAGQPFSITRCDLLMSKFGMKQQAGPWLAARQSYVCVRARDGRTAFLLKGILPGDYETIRFHIGVVPKVNHGDPSAYRADHPLNPNVNGLHWDWKGGYIFMALEGLWQSESGELHGFSYHLANDPLLMTAELPLIASISSNTNVRITLDIAKVLDAVRFTQDASSTHSREGDELARTLASNVVSAFVATAETHDYAATGTTTAIAVQLPPNATPYRFTYPSSFPRPLLPTDNPLTVQGVVLGGRLFNETLLSVNGKQSCASCHEEPAAFSNPGMKFSRGAEGQFGERNTMPIFNLAWKRTFFWDGRVAALRDQPRVPIENPIELHETFTNVAKKLAGTETYPPLFAAAFGSDEITPERIGLALEQFMLVQVGGDSKFDRALRGEVAFTEQEKRGFALFSTEFDPYHEQYGADCFHCHGGPLFVNKDFANNGLDDTFADKGRFAVTQNPGDTGKFSVPSLRNVAVTAPYMHDGRFGTLEEVVDHYAGGVKRSATLDPNIAKHPESGLSLSDEDKQAIIAFLKSLTDYRFTNPP
jgi:cytochrome c peroxidase